jgi:hypothetical protein
MSKVDSGRTFRKGRSATVVRLLLQENRRRIEIIPFLASGRKFVLRGASIGVAANVRRKYACRM